MSFLKIWRPKHEKLAEELIGQRTEMEIKHRNEMNTTLEDSREEVFSFRLKYLGSTSVQSTVSMNNNLEEIKVILKKIERSKRGVTRAVMIISLRNLEVTDLKRNSIIQAPILSISNCCVNSTHKEILSFVTTDEFSNKICHAFVCQKRKITETVTLAIDHMYSKAYQTYVNTLQTEEFLRRRDGESDEILGEIEISTNETIKEIIGDELIDLEQDLSLETSDNFSISGYCAEIKGENKKHWVSFEE